MKMTRNIKQIMLASLVALFMLVMAVPVYAADTPPPADTSTTTPADSSSSSSSSSAIPADNKKALCDGVNLLDSGSNCDDPAGSTSNIAEVVKTVIKFLSYVVGIISVVMIIIGGLKYIISTGDSNNINSAKNTILYAIIGLVVVAFAQVIVLFVLNNF